MKGPLNLAHIHLHFSIFIFHIYVNIYIYIYIYIQARIQDFSQGGGKIQQNITLCARSAHKVKSARAKRARFPPPSERV